MLRAGYTRKTQSANAYEQYRERTFFPDLDGLRCLSIIAVIWHHTGIRSPDFRLSQQGHLGVDLFFAISGFLITTLLLREQARYGMISLRAFYLRRSLRIFPLYYTILLLYVLVTFLFERTTSAGQEFFVNLPYFTTYTSNWFVKLDGRVIFYFAWSLATEEQFYLVWPLVQSLLNRRAVLVMLGLLILRVWVAYGVSENLLASDRFAVILVLSMHPGILGGAILAHLLHNEKTFRLLFPLLGRKGAALSLLVALLVALQALSIGWIWTTMVLLVGAVVARETNSLSWLLSWKPIAHVGLVSYGMYLMHMLCFNVVKRAFIASGLDSVWLQFLVTLLLVTFVASFSYRYYESYFLRLKRRFERIPTRRPAERRAALVEQHEPYRHAGKSVL
jgi:peptidoglycan/LPS O-acetylase OafA/YrhL